jgi:hypothetical protein
MPYLDEIVGSFLSSLAHARKIADEETAAIAEYYKTQPLLEGMTVPRVRVPELILDLPLLVESYEEGEPGIPNEPGKIKETVITTFDTIIAEEKIDLPEGFKAKFEKNLDDNLKRVLKDIDLSKQRCLRELLAKEVESSFLKTYGSFRPRIKDPRALEKRKLIVSRVRDTAFNNALKSEGKSPVIKVNVVTSEIKELSNEKNITRLKLVLKEEGLEWSEFEKPDGTAVKKLTPE